MKAENLQKTGEKEGMPFEPTCVASFSNNKSEIVHKAARAGILILLISILAFSSAQPGYSATFELTLTTTKQVYSAGDKIDIKGNLTLNQNPVPDGIVAIQVNDARGYLRALRVRPTGTNITKSWPVEILSVVPTSGGGPAYQFRRGSDIGFNVSIKNNDLAPRELNLTICIYYPDKVPLRTASIWSGTIGPNETILASSWPFATISSTAPLGRAVAYASITRPQLPQDGGFAYAPEKAVAFDIVTTITPSPPPPPPSFAPTPDGTFNITFSTPRVNARLGNYTVYATVFYLVGPYPYFASTSTTFTVIIIGDLNGDGKCDIKDISIVAKAYGSYPGYPNWNPIADLYPDMKIDIRDVAIVAKDFGKTGIYP